MKGLRELGWVEREPREWDNLMIKNVEFERALNQFVGDKLGVRDLENFMSSSKSSGHHRRRTRRVKVVFLSSCNPGTLSGPMTARLISHREE